MLIPMDTSGTWKSTKLKVGGGSTGQIHDGSFPYPKLSCIRHANGILEGSLMGNMDWKSTCRRFDSAPSHSVNEVRLERGG